MAFKRQKTKHGPPRLVQLFHKNNSTGNTTIDIVAVHGIETQSPNTWIAYEHGGKLKGRATNWLCDEDMLPTVVPQARIWAYEYNSSCYSDNAQKVDILALGDTFLEILRGAQDKGIGKRMLLFIGSCFGGIVVAQALARAFRNEYKSLMRSTAGVVFLGTPLRGTATASIAQWLVFLRGSLGKATSPTLLKSLKEKESGLNNVIHDFAEIAIQNEIQIRCFYETRKTQIAKVVTSGWTFNLFPSVELVPKESACLDGHKRLPLDANHTMMNKFRSPIDGNFKIVSNSLKELVDNTQVSMVKLKPKFNVANFFSLINQGEEYSRHPRRDRKIESSIAALYCFAQANTMLRESGNDDPFLGLKVYFRLMTVEYDLSHNRHWSIDERIQHVRHAQGNGFKAWTAAFLSGRAACVAQVSLELAFVDGRMAELDEQKGAKSVGEIRRGKGEALREVDHAMGRLGGLNANKYQIYLARAEEWKKRLTSVSM